MADYQYDVFFSYKRHSLTLDWTRQVHLQLELWLGEELNRPANIFVDTAQIETGMRWPVFCRMLCEHHAAWFVFGRPLTFNRVGVFPNGRAFSGAKSNLGWLRMA
jgi:hypothetical protein